MKTKLYRSRTDSMLGGVCGGLGPYLGIDTALVRIFFILLTISGGAGVLIYLICWVVMPLEGGEAVASAAPVGAGAEEISGGIGAAARRASPQAALLLGAALLLFGTVALLRNLGMPWVDWIDAGTLWPLVLIGGGVALMLRRRGGTA